MSYEPARRPNFDVGAPPLFGGRRRTVERSQMKNVTSGSIRILGSLTSADGVGVVRIEERFDADIDEVWSALTETERLGRWYGAIEGELRVGGAYRALLHASGWDGTGRVEECEPPRRFLVVSKGLDEVNEVST